MKAILLISCFALALGKPIDLRDLSLKNMAQELLHKQAPQLRAM